MSQCTMHKMVLQVAAQPNSSSAQMYIPPKFRRVNLVKCTDEEIPPTRALKHVVFHLDCADVSS